MRRTAPDSMVSDSPSGGGILFGVVERYAVRLFGADYVGNCLFYAGVASVLAITCSYVPIDSISSISIGEFIA